MDFVFDVYICNRADRHFDATVAGALQSWLSRVHIPADYRQGIVGPKRARLSVRRLVGIVDPDSPASDDTIAELKQSRKLVVVCTPDFLDSKHCLDVVARFARLRTRAHIHVLLAAGDDNDPQHVFMRAGVQDADRYVTLFADVRAGRLKQVVRELKGFRIPRSEQERMKLLASILECETPDQLVRRAAHRLRQQAIAWTLAATLFITAVIGAYFRVSQLYRVQGESLEVLTALGGDSQLLSPNEYEALEQLADASVDVRLGAIRRLLESESLARQLGNRLPYVVHSVVGVDMEMYELVHQLVQTGDADSGESRADDREAALQAVRSTVVAYPQEFAAVRIQSTADGKSGASSAATAFAANQERTRSVEEIATSMVLGRRSRLSRAYSQQNLPTFRAEFSQASAEISAEDAGVAARTVIGLMKTTTISAEHEALAGALADLAARMDARDCLAALKSTPCVGMVRGRFLHAVRSRFSIPMRDGLWDVVKWAERRGVQVQSTKRL